MKVLCLILCNGCLAVKKDFDEMPCEEESEFGDALSWEGENTTNPSYCEKCKKNTIQNLRCIPDGALAVDEGEVA